MTNTNNIAALISSLRTATTDAARVDALNLYETAPMYVGGVGAIRELHESLRASCLALVELEINSAVSVVR